MNSYRFEGKFVKELESDHAAFEEACGWYDDRDAFIEKWIGPKTGWVPHTDPLYHAWAYYNGKNGGWLMPNKEVIQIDS
jgi:hypothetical protein